jgi:Arc/MetJ family transcription regulator
MMRSEVLMRTTVTIDDALLAKAAELTGVTENVALLRQGLQTLIRVESVGWRHSAALIRVRRLHPGGAERLSDSGRHSDLD